MSWMVCTQIEHTNRLIEQLEGQLKSTEGQLAEIQRREYSKFERLSEEETRSKGLAQELDAEQRKNRDLSCELEQMRTQLQNQLLRTNSVMRPLKAAGVDCGKRGMVPMQDDNECVLDVSLQSTPLHQSGNK